MQQAEFKPGQIHVPHEMINSCILSEMRGLSNSMTLPVFKNIWSGFANYSGLIKKLNKNTKNVYKAVLDASNGTGIVEINNNIPEMHVAYVMAHIAACCELLAGNKIGADKLDPTAFQQYVENLIIQINMASDNAREHMMHKVHTMDAVRTMHLLRALGLITKSPKHYFQLALGAGSGEKDIYSLHKFPEISKEVEAGNMFYRFMIYQEDVAHIVVSDPDPQRMVQYKSYNEKYPDQILAFNEDTEAVLCLFENQSIKKRNLVTAIRLDHHMIPDPVLFLRKLVHCLDEQCDLIFTIGSGDSPDDLIGRMFVLSELFRLLEKARLRPVLFKFHGQGDIMAQYMSLRFGNPFASTYQVLFCKLRRQELLKMLKY